MPGFFVTNMEADIELVNECQDNCVERSITSQYIVKQNTLNKFIDEKIIFENDKYLIITEGVILNSRELMETYHTRTLNALIISMYEHIGNEFVKEFRGGFSGVLINKASNIVLAWTGHCGDNAVFYYFSDGKFMISSDVGYILSGLSKLGIKKHLDSQCIYRMLTYGFMCDEHTICSEIKRIHPGCYILIENDNLFQKAYYTLTNNKLDLSLLTENEIIEELDKRFRTAVKLEFDKDLEYGYKHLVDISGGFDCRMTTMVAHEMGYSDFLSISYSQFPSNEIEIAAQISSMIGSTFIYRSLNDCRFLLNPERSERLANGIDKYCAITGGEDLLNKLNTKPYGIEHTGMIGDVVVGSFLERDEEQTKRNLGGMYSTILEEYVDSEHIYRYPNTEMQKMYIRGFYGACSTYLVRRNYVEVSSPFMNPDFLDYCMSIPVSLRAHHKLYDKWVLKKHPNAASIRWSHNDKKLTDNFLMGLARQIRYRGLEKAKKTIFKNTISGFGMNPFDYWYTKNSTVRKFMDNYFFDNIDGICVDEIIKERMKKMYLSGMTYDKALCISTIAAVKYIMGI